MGWAVPLRLMTLPSRQLETVDEEPSKRERYHFPFGIRDPQILGDLGLALDRLADGDSRYTEIGGQFTLRRQRVFGAQCAIGNGIPYHRLDLAVQRLLPVRVDFRYTLGQFAHW